MRQERLTHNEWKLLEKVKKIPQSFKIVTPATEGADAALTKVLPSIDFLHVCNQAFEEHTDDEIPTSMTVIGKVKLNKYSNATDRVLIYLTAVVLESRVGCAERRVGCAERRSSWIERDNSKLIKN